MRRIPGKVRYRSRKDQNDSDVSLEPCSSLTPVRSKFIPFVPLDCRRERKILIVVGEQAKENFESVRTLVFTTLDLNILHTWVSASVK